MQFEIRHAVLLCTRAAEPTLWTSDEYTEIYQIVQAEAMKAPRLRASLFIPDFVVRGGGYARAVAMSDNGAAFLTYFRWGAREDEYKAIYIPRSVCAELTDGPTHWGYLRKLAKQKTHFSSMFLRVLDVGSILMQSSLKYTTKRLGDREHTRDCALLKYMLV